MSLIAEDHGLAVRPVAKPFERPMAQMNDPAVVNAPRRPRPDRASMRDDLAGRRAALKSRRRQAIVAAARQSFLQDGYAATTMSSLSKAIGGSKSTLWVYFPSKEALFAAVVEDLTIGFRQQLESGLDTGGDIKATLENFCAKLMLKMSDADALLTWRLIVAETGRFPEIGRIFFDRAASYLERALIRYFDRQVAEGRLLQGDTSDMARFLITLCTGRRERALLGALPSHEAEIDADAERFVAYFLRLFEASTGDA